MIQPNPSRIDADGERWRAVLAVGLLLGSGLGAAVSVPVVLLLAPALFLFFALSLGRFPGEKVIENVIGWRSRGRIATAPTSESVPEPLYLMARAGRQIAYALAVRPPPRSSVRHP